MVTVSAPPSPACLSAGRARLSLCLEGASALAPGIVGFRSESLLGSMEELMPSYSSQGQSVSPCKARNVQAEQTRKRGRLWQARPRAGRQAHKATAWAPAVLSLKTGWDSLKGEVPSSSTFSFSFMLESEGHSKPHVLLPQLHSQLAVTFQLLLSQELHPFLFLAISARTQERDVQGPRPCENLERANVRGGVWLPGVCGWAPRPVLGSLRRTLKH